MTKRTTPDQNEAIVRQFFAVGPSKGDLAAADALLAPDFAVHTPFPETGPGIESINTIITTCREAFHGLSVTILDVIAVDDRITVRFVAHGTHQGAFMGLPPTGKRIALSGIEIFRIKDGKIAELWGEANLMGLMQQLGILPSAV
jgi:steroid delta-isomerase-like uncharacterized protein